MSTTDLDALYRLRTYGGARSPWVFHHTFSYRNVEAGDRIGTMKTAVSEAAKRAELPDEWRKHDLRHRRVTTWLSAEKSPAIVQRAMGHADIKTTLSYYTFVRSDLKHLVEEGPAEKRDVAAEKREVAALTR